MESADPTLSKKGNNYHPPGIYSVGTFKTYTKKCTAFCNWCREKHGCRTIEECKPYIKEYLNVLKNAPEIVSESGRKEWTDYNDAESTSGNGFQTVKDNPAYKAYTTMVARYIQGITKLLDLVPSDNLYVPGEQLMEFINHEKAK